MSISINEGDLKLLAEFFLDETCQKKINVMFEFD